MVSYLRAIVKTEERHRDSRIELKNAADGLAQSMDQGRLSHSPCETNARSEEAASVRPRGLTRSGQKAQAKDISLVVMCRTLKFPLSGGT